MTACATVPMASAEKDAKAKTFITQPDKANIYVYRNELFGAAVKLDLSLDGKPLGKTVAMSYFAVEVEPGKHTLISTAENISTLEVESKAGNSDFIRQEVKMGIWLPRSELQIVDAQVGRKSVLECKLIEPVLFVSEFPTTTMAHERDSWYIGFGLGFSPNASWVINGDTITIEDWLYGLDATTKIFESFKIGVTLNPKTLVGFEFSAVRGEGTSPGLSGYTQINNYFTVLTYFPYKEGFFVRAGIGPSNIMYSISSSVISGKEVHKGYGDLLGIGYAFWLGKGFNLTLNYDVSVQIYPGGIDAPTSSQFSTFYIGFDWY